MTAWAEGVSLILPVQNAEAILPAFFQSLHHCDVLEVLVCDQGSTDMTAAVAREHGAHVFRTGQDLGEVINNAVGHARGTCLWFLPPTAHPPDLAAAYIVGVLEESEIAGGYFPVRFYRHDRLQRLRSWRKNLAAGYFGRVTMEHGFFVSQRVFQNSGGAPHDAHPIASLHRKVRGLGEIFLMPDCIEIVLPD